MSIEIPSVTEEALVDQKLLADKHRRRSLVSRIDSASGRIASLTGTQPNHRNLPRFAGVISGVVGATMLAGALPDHQVAAAISDIIGATGGAFAGDNFRPISRIGETRINKFIRGIRNGEPVTQEKLAKFFRRYCDIVTEDEIRERLLGRIPASDKNPNDPRYIVIDEIAKRYREEHEKEPKTGKKGAGEKRKTEREYVTKVILEAQMLAQKERANPKRIRHEGLKRAGDALSGVFLIGTLAALINVYFGETHGGLVGLTDDLVMFLVILISALSRESAEKFETNGNRRSEPFQSTVNYPRKITRRERLPVVRPNVKPRNMRR